MARVEREKPRNVHPNWVEYENGPIRVVGDFDRKSLCDSVFVELADPLALDTAPIRVTAVLRPPEVRELRDTLTALLDRLTAHKIYTGKPSDEPR